VTARFLPLNCLTTMRNEIGGPGAQAVKTDVSGQLKGVQNDDACQAPTAMCPTRISPRMQARSLKHRYSPIGELRLDLTHDLVVNRKCSRRLDGIGRTGLELAECIALENEIRLLRVSLKKKRAYLRRCLKGGMDVENGPLESRGAHCAGVVSPEDAESAPICRPTLFNSG
jgi:hypothetical protein